jgi:dihydrofolate reductase
VSRVRLSLVAAVARNGVIGANQAMPWRLSTDLRRFKRLTWGKPVILGRKTFETIGKPLAGRANIVITRTSDMKREGVTFASSIDKAIVAAEAEATVSGADEAMVIGGGMVYAATIMMADRLYVTHVEAAPPGDTRFPAIDPAVWKSISSESVPASDKDSVATRFVIYERIGAKSASVET